MGFDEDNANHMEWIRWSRGGRHDRTWDELSFIKTLGVANREELTDRIDILTDGIVLDIACGEGNALDDLAGIYPHLQFKGVDIYADRNKTTKTRDNICIDKQDAQNLDIPDDSVDIAYSVWGLAHMVDKLRAVRECHRVLKPGGLGILTVYSRFIAVGSLDQPLHPSEDGCVQWDDKRRALIVRKNGSTEQPLKEFRYARIVHRDCQIGVISHYTQVPS